MFKIHVDYPSFDEEIEIMESVTSGVTNAMKSVLKKAASVQNLDPIYLPSGATHDASAMSELCPMAMLFVRCHRGISHTPEEFAKETDMQAAVKCLVEFMKILKQ